MATLKVKTYIEVADSNEIRPFGSDTNFTEVTLDGGGKTHYLRFDDIDTSSTPQLLYDSSSTPIPSGAKVYFIRSNVSGDIIYDDGTSNGVTSALPIYPNIWVCLGGASFKTDSSYTTAVLRAAASGTQIDRIYFKATSGSSADVEILGVS